MKLTTRLRLIGALILLFNLWLGGEYNIQGMTLLMMTFGFVFLYEFAVVRPVENAVKEY